MPGMDHSASPAAGDADVMFASMMIVHHRQAVEMSALILDKDGVDPRVTDLAERIQAAQQPEIEQLQRWLDDWGVAADDGAGMDHGDGMMTDDDLAALDAARGPEASRLFLEQMIAHHEGAIEMAQEQIALARAIVEAQGAEIAEMTGILATL
jgi:uncharacterized protein (DUF305 family)